MGSNMVVSAIRNLFGTIDGVIYGLIGTVYNLLVEIAHFRIFSDDALDEFAARIYTILGIFMLFKLSFSFINYMINPDAFTDKERGVQNLIKNIIIMFAMLIMCPWAFRQLWGLQAAILDDNIIPRFIFGSVSSAASESRYSDECSDGEYIDNSTPQMGNYIATIVLKTFYQPYNNSDLEGTDEYDDTVRLLCDASTKNISYMLSDSIYNATVKMDWFFGDEMYIMEYPILVTTLAGGAVLLILVSFCLDVGARMVKLSFLQLIAPIPIISYIDPASGKNGIFKKWLKEVGSTWVSIFIKLIALFFAVAVIQQLETLVPVGENVEDHASVWVHLFVIIGALMFAKQLPKLLGDIFGIKMDGGSFSVNPLKKIEKEALGGKAISRAPKAAAGAAMGLGMGVVGAATGAGPGRILTGMLGGASDGFKGKRMAEMHKGQVDQNARMRQATADGSTFGGRMGARMSNFIGSKGAAGRIISKDKELEKEIKERQNFQSSFDSMKSEISKAIEGGKLGDISEKYNGLKSDLEAAKIKRDSIKKDDYYVTRTRQQLNARNEMEEVTETAFDSATYDADVLAAANAVVAAENAVGKYLKKDGIEAYYNNYREYQRQVKEDLIEAGDESICKLDSGIIRAINQLDTEAEILNVSSEDLAQYSIKDSAGKQIGGINKYADDVSNEIAQRQTVRAKNREALQHANANRDAIK